MDNRPSMFTRPIVHGNYSRYFKNGARKSDNHTHQWTVYLRPYYENDPILSKHFVKKVIFQLHESYPNRNRTFVNGPPYEVTETGWGEFEVVIRIFWKDCTERLMIVHPLKLFTDDPENNPAITSGNKPYRIEHFNEIVFCNPSVTMFKNILSRLPPIPDDLVGAEAQNLKCFPKDYIFCEEPAKPEPASKPLEILPNEPVKKPEILADKPKRPKNDPEIIILEEDQPIDKKSEKKSEKDKDKKTDKLAPARGKHSTRSTTPTINPEGVKGHTRRKRTSNPENEDPKASKKEEKGNLVESINLSDPNQPLVLKKSKKVGRRSKDEMREIRESQNKNYEKRSLRDKEKKTSSGDSSKKENIKSGPNPGEEERPSSRNKNREGSTKEDDSLEIIEIKPSKKSKKEKDKKISGSTPEVFVVPDKIETSTQPILKENLDDSKNSETLSQTSNQDASSSQNTSIPSTNLDSKNTDVVRHLPYGHIHDFPEEIPLIPEVMLTKPRSDLAHNYVELEKQTLKNIKIAEDRIKQEIHRLDELKRVKLHFLEALLDSC